VNLPCGITAVTSGCPWGGYGLPRTHPLEITDADPVERNRLFRAVGSDAPGAFRREPEQRANRTAGLLAGA
jgi:hypothetical protein